MALRILVVDDDVTTLRVLHAVLGAEGFEVHTSEKPSHALKLLEQARFDVLVTDFVMAEMGGQQLIDAARGLQADLRCCVMSGHPRARDTPEDVRWISKPLDIDVLLAAIAEP